MRPIIMSWSRYVAMKSGLLGPTPCWRCLLSTERGETTMNIFDRKAKRMQRDRTTLLPDYKVYEYLKDEDVDDIIMKYPSMFELMHDLKGMGENNCSWSRKPMLHRDTMAAAAAIYKDMYGDEEGVLATYQIIYFIGWKPDPSQPKSAARGSGQVSLRDIDKLNELVKDLGKLSDNKDPGKKN